MLILSDLKNIKFWWPVNIPRPRDGGEIEQVQIEMQFLLDPPKSEIGDSEIVIDAILRVATGWRGVQLETGAEAELTRDNLLALCNAFSTADMAIYGAYLSAKSGRAAEKN